MEVEVNAAVTNEVTTAATCEADGVRTYTAKVTFEGKEYTDTKTEVIPATGHAYGTPVWKWTDDFTASATFTCGNDTSHVKTVNATVTNEVTTEATCESTGVRTYTAKVTFDGKDYTDTKTEVIPALGHDYKDGKCSRCGAEEPTTPVEPGKPGDSGKPTTPEKPAEPSQPTTPDTPATGDSSNMMQLLFRRRSEQPDGSKVNAHLHLFCFLVLAVDLDTPYQRIDNLRGKLPDVRVISKCFHQQL